MRLVSDDCNSNDTILTDNNDENNPPQYSINMNNDNNDMNFSALFQKNTNKIDYSTKMTTYDIERTQSYDDRYMINTTNTTPISNGNNNNTNIKDYNGIYDEDDVDQM